MVTYRAAVIGLGRMGSTFDDEIQQGGCLFLPYCHAPSYASSPLTRLVAGADPHEGQRAAFAQRWGLDSAHVYSDYRAMLEKERPDIVSVCTTARIRSEIVQHAARSGVKAIWAEKPISISLAEADAMVEACRAHGVALAVNCARRWNPFFSVTRGLIDQGELGNVLQVTAYGSCGLSHNGSHLLDLVRFLAGGEVQWVFGEMASEEAAAGDQDLQGNGYLAFDNGVRALARGTPCGAAEWEFDVIGSRGRIRAMDNAGHFEWTQLEEGKRRGPVQRPFPFPPRIEGMGLTIIRDLAAAIETGRKPKCSGEDGRAALEIAIALRESHRRGGARVNLPLADRQLKILSAETDHDNEPAIVRRQRQAPKA
ncbi:MAG: Gfo/Idh/MocA family oxidoreductase [Planctomycetes bacterium]|nr:Gfo/Idh/MocA family oxidoreductase [Planctomycetota bacterium]